MSTPATDTLQDGDYLEGQPVETAQPTDTPKEIDWEKRYKDTQSAYTKARQEAVALQAKIKVLEEQVVPTLELDKDVEEELESLKFSDPDKWYQKMKQLESEAQTKRSQKLDAATSQLTELERRKMVLEQFQEENPHLTITDDVIKWDVPPRITKKLENNEISFDEFLNEVKTYLETQKVVKDPNKILKQPNLGTKAGGESPDESAVKKDAVKTYEQEIF